MTARPDRLTGRPNGPPAAAAAMADPLSDVLRSIRLTGGLFLDARFTAPWCVVTELTAADCEPFLTTPARVIAYHVVIEGGLLLSVGSGPAVEVRAGEIVLLPRNDGHVLASAPGLSPVDAHDLIRPSPGGGLARIAHGGGGGATRIVCGFLGGEEAHHPLIAALPRVLKLDVREGASRDWIEASVRFAAGEVASGRLAEPGVLSRLSELLLIEAVRRYSATLPDEEVGWLRGLGDPRVGRALALIHQETGISWSTASLAREVALSRSAFVDRFSSLVGVPPIRYLTAWRLRAARARLREPGRTVGQLAHAAGYESAEAFSRAFKREFGLSPARWREREATGG